VSRVPSSRHLAVATTLRQQGYRSDGTAEQLHEIAFAQNFDLTPLAHQHLGPAQLRAFVLSSCQLGQVLESGYEYFSVPGDSATRDRPAVNSSLLSLTPRDGQRTGEGDRPPVEGMRFAWMNARPGFGWDRCSFPEAMAAASFSGPQGSHQ
jgi:hypothetical protein